MAIKLSLLIPATVYGADLYVMEAF